MKKAILFLTGIFNAGIFWAVAQVCTPDPQYTATGIYPPCPLDTAYVGTPYSMVITLVVPADTVISGFPVTIDSVRLDNITNLPAGLNYTCEPSNCKWKGGTSGCVLITGTPTTVGNYFLQAQTAVKIALFGWISQPLDYCTLTVALPTTIIENEISRNFSIIGNEPNPFNKNTAIKFYSPEKTEMEFKVYNLIGKVIYKRKINAETGMNQFEFSSGNLSEGIYMYSLGIGLMVQTKRMIVAQEK